MASPREAYQFTKSLSPILESIGHTLFNNFGINHFGCIKVNKERLMLHVANHDAWNNIYFQEKFYNDVEMYGIANLPLNTVRKRYLSGSPTNKHSKILFENNLWNFLLIDTKTSTEGTFFFFGTTKDNEKVLHYYLNQPEIFDHFIMNLKQRLSPFLHMDKNNCLQLSIDPLNVSTTPDSTTLIKEFKNHTQISANTLFNMLKDQPKLKLETRCLLYLMEGYTMEEIAKTLNIPLENIKSYLEHMKQKKGLHNRPFFPPQLFKNL